MTTIDDVTRRLLNFGTVEDITCDEEGESVILATHPNGTTIAFPYADSGERASCVVNARQELRRLGVVDVRWKHIV